MANKRKLKRTINYVCGDLFAECVAASLYSGKQEAESRSCQVPQGAQRAALRLR